MNPSINNIEEFQKKCQELREKVLQMCIKAGTGHVTSSFSCVEILAALYYTGILKYDPANPKWEDRDRFILSKGQASPLLYVLLADLGFCPKDSLNKFCCSDGLFGVHLQNDVPGVEMTAGSLGHGLGVGAGIALSSKMNNKSYKVFCVLGDGECYEGSIWESAMFVSHYNLTNLITIVDRNALCVTDYTEKIVHLDPLEEKFKSFGLNAISINGHSYDELMDTLDKAMNSDKPTIIIANTIKGKGIPFMENKPLWHGLAPQGEDAERAIKELTGKGE